MNSGIAIIRSFLFKVHQECVSKGQRGCFACAHACTHSCWVHVWEDEKVLLCVEVRGQLWVSFLRHSLLFIWDQVSPCPRTLPSTSWAASFWDLPVSASRLTMTGVKACTAAEGFSHSFGGNLNSGLHHCETGLLPSLGQALDSEVLLID